MAAMPAAGPRARIGNAQRQPAASTLQRIEDWLFAHLPLEDEL